MYRLKLILIIIAAVLLLSGCAQTEGNLSPIQGSEIQAYTSENPASIADSYREREEDENVPELQRHIRSLQQDNGDIIGWLEIPGTPIDDMVLFHYDNSFYHRRDASGNFDMYGVFYADKRSTFGDGSREQLGLNTCIYGHTFTDNPEDDDYLMRFAPLHNFRQTEFARQHPYLIFSTSQETMIFEIFAVFVANSDNVDVPFNRNDIAVDRFHAMINNEILPRSLYHYDVEIKEGDKFISLSTCIFTMPDGTPVPEGDRFMRLGIMARLIPENAQLKEEATLTINLNPLFDPFGSMMPDDDNVDFL